MKLNEAVAMSMHEEALRDYFAGIALGQTLALMDMADDDELPPDAKIPSRVSKMAYTLANAMMEERAMDMANRAADRLRREQG